MRKHIVLSASLSLIAGSLAAQYAGEGPGVVNALAAFPSLGATALACAQVQQVGLVPHASLGAGVYYCVATIIPTGGGSSKLQSGTFNAQTGVYTKNTDVDTTTIAGDFAGNVSDDLLTLVTDSSTGPKYQTRLTPSGAWGVRAAITGVPATYNDSNICRVGTQLKYIFINGVAIQFGDFNTTTGVVSNIVTLTTPPAGTTQCHSPAPVFDAAGKCYGITFSSINGAGSSVFLTCALDNTARKDKIMNGTADWIANGSVSGGTVTYAADMAANGTYDDPRQIGLVFTNDTTVPSAGRTVNLRLWAPIKKASDQINSALSTF